METTHLFASLKDKATGSETIFNIKVTEEQREKIITDTGYREFIVESFTRLACINLRKTIENCIVDVLKPEGTNYDRYLLALTKVPAVVMEGITMDLTGAEFQKQ